MTEQKLVADTDEALHAYQTGWSLGQDLLLEMLQQNIGANKNIPVDLRREIQSWLKIVAQQVKEIR
jgi:hypothetical protein